MKISAIFSNREIALIVWTILLLVWVSFKFPDFWQSVWRFLAAVAGLWKAIMLMISYIGI
jgi:hypothetical protein